MASIFGGPMGGMIGSVIGGVVSGAVNAASNAANKKPGTSSSGSSSSSSSGSSRPASGGSSNSSGSSGGGNVLESVNGKAPSNAQIGDTIVTNGGSWKITGQNPDGSWISEKVSDVSKGSSSGSTSTKAPSNFNGSANSVIVNGADQQAIKDKMNANSQAWWNATTQEEKDRLKAENQYLAGLLGGSVSYDGHTGTWSGTAGQTMPEAEKVDAGDFQSTLDKWLEAAKQQSQNANDYAVSQSINELTRAEEEAQAQFQTQRDQIAAQEALNKDNHALYAEARGDRGGIGEAQYDSIMNTAMQQQAAVNQAQTKLSTDTARQIADLRARGEFQKADDLLELTQNYLSQLISLQQWSLSYNLSVDQFNASLRQWQKEFDLSVGQLLGSYNGAPTLEAQQIAYNQQQDLQQQLASAGSTLLGTGIMPSEAQLNAMGMTKDQAQSYIKAWQIANTAPSGGGSGGGSGSTSDPNAYSSIYQQMYDAGIRSYGKAYDYLTARDYTDTEAKTLSSEFESMLESGEFKKTSAVSQAYEILANMKVTDAQRKDPEFYATQIYNLYRDGTLALSRGDIETLLRKFGYDPADYLD